jgi:hypothetical protein
MAVAFFFQYNSKKILLIGLSVMILTAAGYFGATPLINAVTYRIQVHRFYNMPREDMIYDFEYLMTALEENWPFFNLSVSANGVNVHELAANTRAILQDPATEIHDPFVFLGLIQEHFFTPINQLGHLQPTWDYESFFETRQQYQERVSAGVHTRTSVYLNEIYQRPESVLFYTLLRKADERSAPPPREPEPVMEFDILDEERIAYMKINQMINIWDDRTSIIHRNMWHYEALMYDFNLRIEGYEHLIIDLRGNSGGRTMQFDNFIIPHLLNEPVNINTYTFYMNGDYADKAREIFDFGEVYPLYVFQNMSAEWVRELNDSHERFVFTKAHFPEPLPYLNNDIDFGHAFESNYTVSPGQDWNIISGYESVLFNGEIWLLTDERTASTAEAVTALLKYSGMATVVGEPTRGVMNVTHEPTTISISLPNTGIIVCFNVAYYTDLQGRPLQGYGIQPHYQNRLGMDALETVLAMIDERG